MSSKDILNISQTTSTSPLSRASSQSNIAHLVDLGTPPRPSTPNSVASTNQLSFATPPPYELPSLPSMSSLHVSSPHHSIYSAHDYALKSIDTVPDVLPLPTQLTSHGSKKHGFQTLLASSLPAAPPISISAQAQFSILTNESLSTTLNSSNRIQLLEPCYNIETNNRRSQRNSVSSTGSSNTFISLNSCMCDSNTCRDFIASPFVDGKLQTTGLPKSASYNSNLQPGQVGLLSNHSTHSLPPIKLSSMDFQPTYLSPTLESPCLSIVLQEDLTDHSDEYNHALSPRQEKCLQLAKKELCALDSALPKHPAPEMLKKKWPIQQKPGHGTETPAQRRSFQADDQLRQNCNSNKNNGHPYRTLSASKRGHCLVSSNGSKPSSWSDQSGLEPLDYVSKKRIEAANEKVDKSFNFDFETRIDQAQKPADSDDMLQSLTEFPWINENPFTEPCPIFSKDSSLDVGSCRKTNGTSLSQTTTILAPFETRENKSVPKLNRVQSDLYDSQRPTAAAESFLVNKLGRSSVASLCTEADPNEPNYLPTDSQSLILQPKAKIVSKKSVASVQSQKSKPGLDSVVANDMGRANLLAPFSYADSQTVKCQSQEEDKLKKSGSKFSFFRRNNSFSSISASSKKIKRIASTLGHHSIFGSSSRKRSALNVEEASSNGSSVQQSLDTSKPTRTESGSNAPAPLGNDHKLCEKKPEPRYLEYLSPGSSSESSANRLEKIKSFSSLSSASSSSSFGSSFFQYLSPNTRSFSPDNIVKPTTRSIQVSSVAPKRQLSLSYKKPATCEYALESEKPPPTKPVPSTSNETHCPTFHSPSSANVRSLSSVTSRSTSSFHLVSSDSSNFSFPRSFSFSHSTFPESLKGFSTTRSRNWSQSSRASNTSFKLPTAYSQSSLQILKR